MSSTRIFAAAAIFTCAVSFTAPAWAQDDDAEGERSLQSMNMGGSISKGIPRFCTDPTVITTGSGNWSDPATWSTKKLPAAEDLVLIKAGHTVTYDTVSDAALKCIDVEGRVEFKTDVPTRLTVGTLHVLPTGLSSTLGS